MLPRNVFILWLRKITKHRSSLDHSGSLNSIMLIKMNKPEHLLDLPWTILVVAFAVRVVEYRTVANIYNGARCDNSERLQAINYYRKEFYLRHLQGSCIRLWPKRFNFMLVLIVLWTSIEINFDLMVRATEKKMKPSNFRKLRVGRYAKYFRFLILFSMRFYSYRHKSFGMLS